ncbi:MAG: alpha/beta hydrolase [Candidatus Saccharimonadales bacterium]
MKLTDTTGLILDINVDYQLAEHMVVFSHGFGVERTGRGLFSDIVTALPSNFGYVMFDYYEHEDNTVRITSFEDQQCSLLTIIAWLSEQGSVHDISLVAHSMGCIVAALAQPPELQRAVMLAPPLSFDSKIRKYFLEQPGATNNDGSWSIPRRDGTATIITESVFDEIEHLQPAEALLDYAAVQPYELLIPTDDDVLGTVDYNDLSLDPNISARTIAEADHNFSGVSREPLVAAVIDWLTSPTL